MKKILITEAQLKSVLEHVNSDVYFETFSGAVQTAREAVEKKGYEINEDDWFTQVNTGPGKPSEGKTTRMSIGLMKNGKEQKKSLHIQVYNMGRKYELNYYVN